MSIPFFLAISAEEFPFISPLPEKTAWMSVHFSPKGPGVSNSPRGLPEGCLIILDDQIPWSGHSMETVCREMAATLLENRAKWLLLDFERPVTEETALLTSALGQCCRELGVSMAAPLGYSSDRNIAVFISPLPCQTPLERLYQNGRKHWLDVSPSAYLIHIASQGATGQPAHRKSFPDGPYAVFTDPQLRCACCSRPNAGGIDVLLHHNQETIRNMLDAVNADDVQLALGLYQDFREF